jgi:branched-subunit amino acid aminotransferase/4-amino-4-deoxychorismate lyase
MAEPIAYLNGSYLPASAALLPIYDAGFVYGVTISDVCRTFGHRLYRLADHLRRFQTGCRYAGIQLPLDSELTAIAERVVANNLTTLAPGQDLILAMFATPGPIPAYAGQEISGKVASTLGMHTYLVRFSRNAPLFERGARLIVSSVQQPPQSCIDPRVKHRSRLHWWFAEREVRARDPEAQALLLDRDGMITETAIANFLIVREGTILSPPPNRILNGISLQVLREIASDLAIPFMHQPLSLFDCLNADEALLTSTSYCVAGVSQIIGSAIPWPGPMLQRLLSEWSARVGLDIAAQTLANR